jgi:serine/threonine protein kinase
MAEGVRCDPPFDSVVTDAHNSLYVRIHGGSKTAKLRTVEVVRVLRAAVLGVQHLLDVGDFRDILQCMSSYCVLFHADSTVVLAVVHPGQLKASDGLECKEEEDSDTEVIHWKAPELVRDDGTEPDEKSVVYALGAILFECATGQIPFAELTPIEVKAQLCNWERMPSSLIGHEMLRQLVDDSTEPDPNQRLSLDQLMQRLAEIETAESESSVRKRPTEDETPPPPPPELDDGDYEQPNEQEERQPRDPNGMSVFEPYGYNPTTAARMAREDAERMANSSISLGQFADEGDTDAAPSASFD